CAVAHHCRARLRHELLCWLGRDRYHGATAAAQSPQLRHHSCNCGGCQRLVDQIVRRTRRRFRHSLTLCSPRDSAPPHSATCVWMAATMEQHRSTSRRGPHCRAARSYLPLAPPRRGGADHVDDSLPRRLRPRLAVPLSAEKKLI